MIQIKQLCFLAALMVFSMSAQADYQLDNGHSELGFISIKKNKIAEYHTFGQLSGGITNSGDASVIIHLITVESSIAIRNERLKSLLFETDLFPTAVVSTQLNMDELSTLKLGDTAVKQVSVSVKLHGNSQVLDATLQVVRLSDQSLLVTTVKPILLNSVDFGLSEGVTKLMEVANLPSISHAVPVSFSLVFKQ